MSGISDGEELGYRSPILSSIQEDKDEASQDVDDFSTLLDVYKKFKREMKTIEHVNLLDVLPCEDEDKASVVLLRQVYAKQEAYKILRPLFDELESAVETVKRIKGGA